ncbi:PREDICTED: R-spondin-2 [Pygoscelis adeliae]|uniref:R-spondin-2 n=1 Tax=Pygoscelis adeliae TaxID=9238 RepID=UPI0004F50567|nr:PREDICTED: R-spondin-2 [Pygoscelis adeliae]
MLFPSRGSHQVSLVPEDSNTQKVSHWLRCFTLHCLASPPACQPLGLLCTRSELNAVVLNLERHVWGTGAEREWECGVQMCEGCRIENCDSCFSRDFCTKCKTGFYSHRGRCFRGCPPGFAALEELMECVEGCEVGQWSEWGTCSRNNKTCGFKWGLETRTRQIVKKPVKDTIPCPTIAESRRCKMAMRHCPGGRRPTKTKDKKKKKKNLMERAQKQHSIFLATDKTSQ